MRRNRRLLGFALAAALSFDIRVAWTQELEKMVIGHSSLRNDMAFLWVPQALGLFQNGVDRPSCLFLVECG
jgi:hypothetical protein